MKIIGVTGSIGMGKSTVSNMLRDMGVPVHDADATVHKLLAAGGAGVTPVAAAFPAALVLNETGGAHIDRKALGAVVFNHPEKRKQLEDILHALIRADSDAFVAEKKAQGHALVALDIPLLFETGGEKRVDVILCVSAPADVQRARVLARPGMTEQRFAAVLAAQMPDAEKRSRAHHVVDTGQGLDHTRAALKKIVEQLSPPPPKTGVKPGFALLVAGIALSLVLGASAAFAKQPDATLVELYTSQGCSSCPPAEEHLTTLDQRDDVIVLAYHVDYWDSLLTFSGRWKDPFSKNEWTQRQTAFNKILSGGTRVYTPQMIVDGRFEGVGSEKGTIDGLINRAHAERQTQIDMTQSRGKDGVMAVTLRGAPVKLGANVGVIGGKTVDIYLANYIRNAATDIKAGENKGRVMRGTHIVQALTKIGTWYGGKMDFRYPLSQVDDQKGCVIFLQDRVNARILSAQECAQ